MNGQWIGQFSGTNTGVVVADLDDVGTSYAGVVFAYFDPMPSSIGYVKAGQLRPLAVTTATRSQALPDLPSVGDAVAGYEASTWYGVGAPKNTPAEVIDRLNKEINAGLADPKLKTRLTELGA